MSEFIELILIAVMSILVLGGVFAAGAWWPTAVSERPSDLLDNYRYQADAVLRKVAEHIREER